MSLQQQNRDLARRVLESWNGGQRKALEVREALFAPGFRMHVAGMPGPVDREGFEHVIAMFAEGFTDDRVTVDSQVAEGDRVLSRWTWTMTHSGSFQGIPATQRRITMQGINEDRFEAGKIAERWVVMDQAGMLQQITAGGEDHKAVVRGLFAKPENLLDRAYMERIYARDYVHHDPALPADMQNGFDSYYRVHRTFMDAFPDLVGTIEDQVAEGDKVVTRMTFRGTQTGELMGIPASGRKVEMSFIGIHRFAKGKVVEGWVNFDALGMMQQIGAIPAPSAA